MIADDDLLGDLASALTPDARTAPPERIAALRAAARNRVPAADQVSTVGPRLASRLLRIAVAAAVAAAAFALGGVVLDRGGAGDDLLAGGVVEFETTLTASDSPARATVTGIRTGIGRVVQLRTDDLPILPTGELYELWFVGPGDTRSDPNRISAGTFHPDEQGRSHVDLTAAANPAVYPELVITAEPGDGNPAATGPEVLRATISIDEP